MDKKTKRNAQFVAGGVAIGYVLFYTRVGKRVRRKVRTLIDSVKK